MTLTNDQVRERVAKVPSWYHRVELREGIVTPGVNNTPLTLQHLDIPKDCTGLRALDLGARDGFFSFELERRGALVTAIDYVPAEVTGFKTCAEIFESKVEYRQANIYSLTPEEYGQYDIVLFLGLLYHLPDPMQAIQIVRSLCKGQMCLETHAIDNGLLLPDGSFKPLREISPVLENVPIAQFYPGTSLSGDHTNYWGPNLKCLEGMLEECRFSVRSSHTLGSRAIVNAEVVEDAKKESMLNLARGLREQA